MLPPPWRRRPRSEARSWREPRDVAWAPSRTDFGARVNGGGDVVLLGDHDTNNLVDYKYQPHWRADRGGHGEGKDCNSREGKPAILRMPLGTVVVDLESGKPKRGAPTFSEQLRAAKAAKGGIPSVLASVKMGDFVEKGAKRVL